MKKTSSSNQSATKSDIKRVENYLKKFATKKDLQQLRSDYKSTKKTLWNEILRAEGKIDNAEEKLSNQMQKQHDQVMTAISNFAGRVETLETENEIDSDQIRRLDERISTLEPVTT